MSVLDELTLDLGWRETEIASMRLLLSSGAMSPSQRTVLLRAAWAMLYAHYEGFCKTALATFYDAITKCGTTGADLPVPTKLLAFRDTLKKLRKMPDSELLVELEGFSTTHLIMKPSFPEVDTQSNLWPSVLIDLIVSADLSAEKVEKHELKLSTLVSRRNDIAHGKNNIIAEFEYYKTYEDVVYEVIYDLAFQIEEKLQSHPYAIGAPA